MGFAFVLWLGMIASVSERFLRAKGLNRILVFFILGIVFSLLGIFLSLQTGVGFVALFIITIAILPVVHKGISLSELLAGRTSKVSKDGLVVEVIELRAHRWSMGQFFSDFWPLFEVYLVYFLVVFGAFILLGSWLDFSSLSQIFSMQFGIFDPNVSVVFQHLIVNNIGVLLLGFLISFVFEFGTTFVVVRNAIFWGLTLGFFLGSAYNTTAGLLLIVPHLLLEASSYFVSSIAGGILSRAVAEEQLESERFYSLFTQVVSLLVISILLVVFAAGVETIVYNSLF